ncbi:MAG TPA: MATE family efflux transporter [Bacteroidaceae bacterium]|nr:MATE family efflux transporter [Bacteroidaceae bacterium]
MSEVNQRRIAINTLLLYGRMLLVLIVGMYTARIVQRALGNDDLGVFGVIGSIVAMFSFLSNAMASASQRYFAHEIGKGGEENLRNTFSLITTVIFGMAFILAIIGEGVGYWWLIRYADITPGRMEAAKWVFHFAILSFFITILATPYRAVIIAREKMKVFAYFSIVEVSINLAIAFLILKSNSDRLILYGALMALSPLIITLGIRAYCKKFYSECSYKFYWNYALFREMASYTGWNLFGSFAGICKSQGLNIVINNFGGTILNSAYYYAFKIFSALSQLIDNFFTAVRPQIIKSYSKGESYSTLKLINQSSKFSFFLALFISLPLLIETPLIMDLWLKLEVPDKTIIFTRLIIINTMIDLLAHPIASGMQATGKIKYYQIFVGGMLLMIIPISLLLLRITSLPIEVVFYVSILISFIAQIGRIIFAHRAFSLSIKKYLLEVLLVITLVTIISIIAPLIAHYFMQSGILRLFVVILVSTISLLIAVWLIGMNNSERLRIKSGVNNSIYRLKKLL